MHPLTELLEAIKQALVDHYGAHEEIVRGIHLLKSANAQNKEIETPAIFIDVGDIEYGTEDDEEESGMILSIPIDIHCVLGTDTENLELAILEFATQIAFVIRCNDFGMKDSVTTETTGMIEVSPINVRQGYEARIVSFTPRLYIESLNPSQPSVPWAGYNAEHHVKENHPDPIKDELNF